MKNGWRMMGLSAALLAAAAFAQGNAVDASANGATAGMPESASPTGPVSMPAMAPAVVGTAPIGGISLAPKTVRDGYYAMDDCQSSGGTAFNECLCKATIQKAEITGLGSAPTTQAINKQLAQVPEQLANESCQGKSTSKPATDINMNETAASFNVPYQTPTVLTALVTYMTYGAGSAHPMTGTEGYTFNLSNGQIVDPLAKLSTAQLDKLNNYVQSELMKKYGETLFDEAKTRTDPYVTENGCDSCTLYYTKDGWNLRFQLYAIAPYAAGEPTITIPTDLIPAPESAK